MCLALFPSRGRGWTSARQRLRPAGVRQAPGPLHSCSNSRRRRWFTPQGPGNIHCPAMPDRVGRSSRIPVKNIARARFGEPAEIGEPADIQHYSSLLGDAAGDSKALGLQIPG